MIEGVSNNERRLKANPLYLHLILANGELVNFVFYKTETNGDFFSRIIVDSHKFVVSLHAER